MTASGPQRVYSERDFRARGPLAIEDARFERCSFDNCAARGGYARRVEVVDARTWACSLNDVVIEDCTLDGLRTRLAGGTKTRPMFLWGSLARRTVLRGLLAGIIWNPPWRTGPAEGDEMAAARRFYEAVDDWALDIREARFRSVPTLNYGPPADLIRRDPETQPAIDRAHAKAALERVGAEIGVWRVVLQKLVDEDWPDAVVLIPPLGAPKRRYDEHLAWLRRLRQIGAFETDRA